MTTEQSTLEQYGLTGVLTELETQRRSLLGRIGKTALGAIILVTALITILQVRHAEPVWSVLAASVGIITWAIISGRIHKRFVKRYKQQVIPRLLERIAPGLNYAPDAYIAKEEFNACGLFIRPDRYSGKDYVAGWLGKTEFRFSLVYAEEEVQTTSTDDDGNTKTETRYDTIFRGLFFSADFNKHFAGNTRIFAGGIGLLSGLRGGLVKLEDPEFNKRFTVYSNDQVEARYILSPALMRRLLDLQKRFATKVEVSFVGARVMLAVPTQTNLLEPRFFRRSDTPEAIIHYVNFLRSAVGLVEDLNLNTRIWTKR